MASDENPYAGFTDFVTSKEELEALSGPPLPQIIAKELTALDGICREFISRSPFCVIATANTDGHIDVSPRGDPPGFVQVLSDTLLAIPDRPGNKRMDSFHNLLSDPRVGILFLIPGKRETLRIRGKARLCKDPKLLETMAVNKRSPKLALLIHVDTVFAHCPKCIMRSNLWQPDNWPDASNLADMNETMIKHAKIPLTAEEWFEELKQKGELDLY